MEPRGRKDSVTLFLAVALFCFGLDIASKYAVAAWLKGGEREVAVIPGWFNVIYRINQGGMWSFGRRFGDAANLALAAFSGLAVAVIFTVAAISLRGGAARFAIVLGAILGGAMGNLFDRIVFGGVRDFLDFHYYEVYHYPTFNIADSCLVCGAVFLFFTSLFSTKTSSLVQQTAESPVSS